MLQRMGVKLGSLSEQSASSPCELCITVLSAHTALLMFLTFIFENILEKKHCLDCF